MTRSPRRRTAVVLSIALVVCLAGMALAVVAFGQTSNYNTDSTVPMGDYTTTTPAKPGATTSPTSSYTVTSPSTPSSPAGGSGSPSTPSGGSSTPRVPTRANRAPVSPTSTTPHVSKATRPGPSRLAFTGGEPLMVGGAGAALMLAAGALQLRRRRGGQAA